MSVTTKRRMELMGEKYNDGVEASAMKTQARFQIIQFSSSAERRMRLGKSENLPEISLSRSQSHHRFY